MTRRPPAGPPPGTAEPVIRRTPEDTAAPPVAVREARPEEAAAVATLVRDTFLGFADELPPDLLRTWVDGVLDPQGATTLVALVEGRLVGTVRLHPADAYPLPLPTGGAGVRALAVSPEHRRSGVARALMAACAERARASGATAVQLHTAPFMKAAVALYEGLGYRRDPAYDVDVGLRSGVATAGEVVLDAYRLDLVPACRVVRGGEGYEGRQGLAYAAGISTESVGAHGLCLHTVTIPPGGRAKAHRHEAHESAIYVVSGTGEFWWGEGLAHRDDTGPGDFIHIPAGVPHLPINTGTGPMVAVIARTDPKEQESVVLMPELDAVPEARGGS